MKRATLFLTFLLMAAALICQSTEESKSANKLDTKKNKISYSLGYDIGSRYKEILLSTDVDSMLKGLRDAVNSAEPTIVAKEEMQKIIQQFFMDLQKKEEGKRKKLGEKNKIDGKAFLEENAKKEGIKTTESGLQYMVLKEGTGSQPGADDTVTIHYKSWLIDGSELLDSYIGGKPVSFPLSKTFPGWAEALKMMNVGAKWKTFLPPELAWGEKGLGEKVGPHAVVIFELELLEIKPANKEK